MQESNLLGWPTLTSQALSWRTADYLANNWRSVAEWDSRVAEVRSNNSPLVAE